MKMVTMTRDMHPWQAGHDAYLPDAAADSLIAFGDAVLKAEQPQSPPPAEKPKPKGRYLTRGRRQ